MMESISTDLKEKKPVAEIHYSMIKMRAFDTALYGQALRCVSKSVPKLSIISTKLKAICRLIRLS